MMNLGSPPEPSTINGTREHAEVVTTTRHPGVQAALQWLTFSHLPEALQRYSRPFYNAAVDLIVEIRQDSAELITALNKLVEAKDSAMRAGIRAAYGRPGSVPRPATVVDPPLLDNRVGPNFGKPKDGGDR